MQDSADRGLDNTVAGTQGALQASDHKYRLLFENMTSGFALHEMVHDAEGRAVDYRFLEVNPAFERLTGIPADRVLGRTVMEVMPQTERYWIDLYDGVVRGGMPVTYENYARALGRYFETISFRAAPGRFAVVFSDVTDRRRAEEALRASERDFRLLAENSTDLVARHAPDSTYLYVSPSCRTMLGYEPEDLIGRPALAFLHPDDLANIKQSSFGVLADPVPDVVTFRMRRKDGTYIWLETSSHTMRDPGSKAKAEIHTSSRDISARREAERTLRQLAHERARGASAAEALAEAGAALATALEPSRLHEIILDHMARVIPCTTVHIFEYRDGWAVVAGARGEPSLKPGVRVMQLAGNEGLFPQTRAQARLLSETRGAPGWRSIPPWVGEFEVRSTIVLPLVLHGETYGCLGIGSSTPGFYDERSFRLALAFGDRIAQALLNARSFTLERQRARAAEQLVFLRNDFVASVSHELRTPLSAILGYGELLQAHWNKLTDEQRQARIGRMIVAANRQKRLIDDLLQVSSLETSVPIVSRESVRLADVVARAVEMVEDSYAGQCIEVKGDTNLCVQADPTYAERILINLIDNAAKYSPEGSPIQVRLAGSGPTISIRVQDLGSGIPSDYLPVLFTRFGRVPGSHMRSGRVGTGLGLYLARQYAQAMHGDLVLEGTSPKGSVFRLDLPAGENA